MLAALAPSASAAATAVAVSERSTADLMLPPYTRRSDPDGSSFRWVGRVMRATSAPQLVPNCNVAGLFAQFVILHVTTTNLENSQAQSENRELNVGYRRSSVSCGPLRYG